MKKLNKIRCRKGFTLVEMMLVVAIIVILAAVAVFGIGSALANSKSKNDRLANDYQPKIESQAEAVRTVLKK